MKYAFKSLFMWLGIVLLVAAIAIPVIECGAADPVEKAVKNYEKFLENPCKRTYKKCVTPESYAAVAIAGKTLFDMDEFYAKYELPESVSERVVYTGETRTGEDGKVYVRFVFKETDSAASNLTINGTKMYDGEVCFIEKDGKYYWDN